MERFLGKWKLAPELTEGFEEYAAAMKIPDALREEMKQNKNVTVETKQEGDEYVSYVDYGNRQETHRFKLGEPVTNNRQGVEIKSIIKLEGDKLVSESDVGGQKTSSVRYVQGDQLITESKGNGATMKSVYKRVE